MGNVPSQPTLANLPKPEEAKLLAFLTDQGFVFGEPLDGGLTHRVTTPPGWCLRNVSESTYSDYVHLELISINLGGLVVATIDGKFTSYDSHCSMWDVHQRNTIVDLSQGQVIDGRFIDKRSVFQANIKRYKALCRCYQGYEERQGECDQAYDTLKKEAVVNGFDFGVHRIVLGNPVCYGFCSQWNRLKKKQKDEGELMLLFPPKTEADKALRAWFYARDVFLGRNGENQDVTLGIQLATKCTTIKDAVWLCSRFPDGPPETRQDAFSALEHAHDPRSYGFVAFFLQSDQAFRAALQAAARLDSVMAQCECLRLDLVGTQDEWLDAGVEASEPTALIVKSHRCALLPDKARYLLRAAELGSRRASFAFAMDFMDKADPERYVVLFECALRGYGRDDTQAACVCLISDYYYFGRHHMANAVYKVGSLFAKELYKGAVFPVGNEVETQFVEFYVEWTKTVTSSVLCWQMVARRLGIIKDIRTVIAKYIWKDRWNEEIEKLHARVCKFVDQHLRDGDNPLIQAGAYPGDCTPALTHFIVPLIGANNFRINKAKADLLDSWFPGAEYYEEAMHDGSNGKIRAINIPTMARKSDKHRARYMAASVEDNSAPTIEWPLLLTVVDALLIGYLYFRQINGQFL